MLFDKIKEDLKEIISKQEHEKFINNLNYNEKKSKSNHHVIEAANPLIAKWVKTKYGTKIADMFEGYTKIRPNIEILAQNTSKLSKNTNLILENKTKSTKLNPSYTFESFVVGPSNQFAYTVAQTAIKSNKIYNPIFLYGGVGLGKTHLLQAIGNFYNEDKKTVLYITAEQFMNDYTHALANHSMEQFREKYRKNCDIFLVDDIQFLSRKTETQQEFFNTFETLHKENKQIILTSDKFPKQIVGLEDRLKSRFLSGQTADIQPPELETKISIIKKKCEIDRIKLDDEVIKFIATNMNESIREIEGVLVKINGFTKMMGEKPNLEITRQILKDHIKEKRENITIEEIIDMVSQELNVKKSEIKSKSKISPVVIARRIVIHLTRELTHNSMPTIAKFFTMKDHSAVSKALKKIEETIQKDENFKDKLDLIRNKISNKNVKDSE